MLYCRIFKYDRTEAFYFKNYLHLYCQSLTLSILRKKKHGWRKDSGTDTLANPRDEEDV